MSAFDLNSPAGADRPRPVTTRHSVSRSFSRSGLTGARDIRRRIDVSVSERPFFDGLKRGFDVLAAIALIIIVSPILLVAAIAVKLSSHGPVLFLQRRTGRGGEVFYIYKFRSMTTQDDGQFVRQAEVDDKRVTPVGAFLRSSSIDELPQLFNVLKGDMSLVGPRPHALAHDELYGRLIPNYALRQAVRPGITGLAQVRRQRGATPTVDIMAARVNSDIQYVRSRSLVLDIKILWQTFGALRGY